MMTSSGGYGFSGGQGSPPGGWGPPGPPVQQLAPAPHGTAPQQAAAAPSVLGVALEPGERVVFFRQTSFGFHKAVHWVMGILMLPMFLVGLFFIYVALTAEKNHPTAYAVTDRRFIFFPARGKAAQVIDFRQVGDVSPKRQSPASSGGAIGMAAQLAANTQADRAARTHISYWANTIGIDFRMHSGTLEVVKTAVGGCGPYVGLAIGQVFAGQAPQMPSTQHEP